MTGRVLALVVMAAGLAAGCGGGSSAGDTAQPPPDTTLPTQSASPPASTPATQPPAPTATATTTVTPSAPPQPAGPQPCASSGLSLALGDPEGAAGSTYIAVVLTNTGSGTCTLFGYPGVSFAGKNGAQVGLPAKRTGSEKRVITLKPGGKASAALRIPDPGVYDPSACQPAKTLAIRVYPPGQKAAKAVDYKAEVCTTDQGRSSIGPLQSGTSPTQ